MQDVNAPQTEKKWYYILLGAFALELLIIGFKGFWTESFWLDETVTAWLLRFPTNELIEKVLLLQGQSPLYYLLLDGWSEIGGTSELSLRLPSVFLCVLSALVFVAIMSKLAVPREGVIVALIILFSLDQFQKCFFARPYGLALFFSVLSTYFLVHALKKSNRSILSWASYIVSLSATFYAHYLFASVMVAHIGVVVFWKDHGKHRAWILSAALALFSFFPGLVHLFSLATRQGEVSFLQPLSLSQAIKVIMPLTMVLYCIIPVALAAVITWKKGERFFSKQVPERLSATVWFTVSPFFTLLAISLVAGSSLLVDRYAAWGVFGLSMLGAIFIAAPQAPRARKIAMLLCVALVLIREAGRSWVIEDWRGSSNIISQSPESTGILVYSGLAELGCERCITNEMNLEYLLSPFLVYSIEHRRILYPIAPTLSKGNLSFMTQVLNSFGKGGFLVLLDRTLPDGTRSSASIIDYLEGAYEISGVSIEGPVKVYGITRIETPAE